MAREVDRGCIVTTDSRTTIALYGGWEMSPTCRGGNTPGNRHAPTPNFLGDTEFRCSKCAAFLHPIGPRTGFTLMSIEEHFIEEEPW